MLFEKLIELLEFVIHGFHMIILYLSIVFSLRELVYVPMDCGVGGADLGFKNVAAYVLYTKTRINKIFTFWSD